MNITKLDYTISQVPKNWPDILAILEAGYSVKLTEGNRTIATLVPSNQIQKKQNFWDALQDFRQQFSPEELDFDEDIFKDVRDRSIGREVFL
jgi:antitoxin (DNA-binding transcriptional repressor) of toxin-antitoxin stability system